jgi:hypothetical protein
MILQLILWYLINIHYFQSFYSSMNKIEKLKYPNFISKINILMSEEPITVCVLLTIIIVICILPFLIGLLMFPSIGNSTLLIQFN